MSDDFGKSAAVRVGLKRIAVMELIEGDEVLRTCRLTASLPKKAAESLWEKGVVRRFNGGAPLFQAGDEGASLFLLARGEARLVARSGRELVELGIAKKGEVLGEGQALGEGKRAYSAVAVGEVDVVELDASAMAELLAASPSVRGYLAEVGKARRSALDEMGAFLGRW